MMYILLDLNETLVKRTYSPENGKGVLVRPGALELLRELSRKYVVCIATSMVEKNARATLQMIHPGWEQYIFRLFSRDYTLPSPTSEKPHGTKRDIPRIAGELGTTEEHLLFVDNEADKYQDMKATVIVVPSWNGDMTDDHLPRLLSSLLAIPII